MDFQSINKINPGLIYASITGYGQTGPYRKRAGYDVMVEAEMGLMHITGSRDGPPVKVGVAVTDLTTGLYTSNSILAALLARAKTGKGQHIDVALSDCQVASLSNIASSALISGQPDTGRWGTSHRKSTLLSSTISNNVHRRQHPSSHTEVSKPETATSFSAAAMTDSLVSCATSSASPSGRRTSVSTPIASASPTG